MIDVGKIDRIADIYARQSVIKGELAMLNKEKKSLDSGIPYSIERLYEVLEASRRYVAEHNKNKKAARDIFLFVAVYMYDPTALVNKLKCGLRKDLVRVLKIDGANISRIIHCVLFRYRHYKTFRADCDAVSDMIQEHTHDGNKE